MKNALVFILIAVSTVGALNARPSAGIWNAVEHGAVADGTTLNTEAIAAAVAGIKEAGGGTLYFPPGRYLTGAIHMESNLTIHLEAGATLLYSGDAAHSPVVRSRWEGNTAYTYSPLIYARDKENIAITGRGTIDGVGRNWWWRNGNYPHERQQEARQWRIDWADLRNRINAGEEITREDYDGVIDHLRPSLVQFYECRNIRVEGVTLRDSPMWLLHAIYSEDIEVRGATFISHGSNGDGIVIDSTRNARISNCFFDTGDDCVVIKSGRDGEGRRIGRPSEAIAVTNCVMYRGNGAVVVGSEMSGGVRGVAASNIVTYGTKRGIRFKTARGRGGVVENLSFDNWVINNARNEAIVLHKGYEGRGEEPVSERTPVLRNISISNVSVQGAREVVKIMGLAEQPIEDLRIHNLHGSGHNGMTVEWVEDFELHNVRIDARPAPPPIRIALANRVTLNNVTGATGGKEPALTLHNTRDLRLFNSRPRPGTDTFVQILGADTRNLRLFNNDYTAAKRGVFIGPDVPAERVVEE